MYREQRQGVDGLADVSANWNDGGMEADTGATATDIVTALTAIGIEVTPADVSANWQAYRELAALFNAGLRGPASRAWP